jgi:hypothetical protein
VRDLAVSVLLESNALEVLLNDDVTHRVEYLVDVGRVGRACKVMVPAQKQCACTR